MWEERDEGRERKGRRGKERFESEGLGREEEEVVVGEEGVSGGGGGGNECYEVLLVEALALVFLGFTFCGGGGDFGGVLSSSAPSTASGRHGSLS